MASAASTPSDSPENPLQQSQSGLSSGVLLIALLILSLIAILVFMLNLYARHLLMRDVHHRRLSALILFGRYGDAGDALGGPSNGGLDPAVIASLPTFAYGRSKEGSSQGDKSAGCPVCLSEMEEGEMVRMLPDCGHVFHVGCVDRWLQFNSTCPICRAEVAAPARGAEVVVDVPVVSESPAATKAVLPNGSEGPTPLSVEDVSTWRKEAGSTSQSGSSTEKV